MKGCVILCGGGGGGGGGVRWKVRFHAFFLSLFQIPFSSENMNSSSHFTLHDFL